MKLINIGFGNMVSAGRLIAIVSPESAPIKRMVQEARDRGVLIDATYGRRTRAVLIMDSDHIVLSALQPETVAGRLGGRENEPAPEEDEDGNESVVSETGVYCMVGMKARFKPVDVLYSGDDFALVRSTLDTAEEVSKTQEQIRLRAGDEVIITAYDLYDGKVIGS